MKFAAGTSIELAKDGSEFYNKDIDSEIMVKSATVYIHGQACNYIGEK